MNQEIMKPLQNNKRGCTESQRDTVTREYIEADKKFKRLDWNAKRNFEKSYLKGKSRITGHFLFVKRKIKSKPFTGPLKDKNKMVANDNEMTEIFHGFF
jgi:hypothetical protein